MLPKSNPLITPSDLYSGSKLGKKANQSKKPNKTTKRKSNKSRTKTIKDDSEKVKISSPQKATRTMPLLADVTTTFAYKKEQIHKFKKIYHCV